MCTRSNCQYEKGVIARVPPSYLGQSEGMTNPVVGGSRIRSFSLFRLCLSCLDAKCMWPTHRTRRRRLLGTGLGGRQDICQILDDLCFKFSLVDIYLAKTLVNGALFLVNSIPRRLLSSSSLSPARLETKAPVCNGKEEEGTVRPRPLRLKGQKREIARSYPLEEKEGQ